MKNLLTILLLSLIVSCANDKGSHKVKDKSINDPQTKEIKVKDSIKQRIEDSINLEVKEAFIKDSINQVEIETSRLIIHKVLDSIYPIWRANKMEYLKDIDHSLNSTKIIHKRIKIIDWLIEIGNNRPAFYISKLSLKDEYKSLLHHLDTAKNWGKSNLIHPILGTYRISSPGDYGSAIGYNMIFEGPTDKGNESFSNENIKDVNIMMENVLIPISTVVFGGGPDFICTEGVDIIGYQIVTNFPHNFINDTLINYLAKKNHIDTTSFERILVSDPIFVTNSYSRGSVLSFSTINPEDYRYYNCSQNYDAYDRYYFLRKMLLINILSKTDPLKVALYLIQKDLGITDLDLIDCKGGIELKINTLSNAGSPMVWQVNGKLYYAGYDISDNMEDYEP